MRGLAARLRLEHRGVSSRRGFQNQRTPFCLRLAKESTDFGSRPLIKLKKTRCHDGNGNGDKRQNPVFLPLSRPLVPCIPCSSSLVLVLVRFSKTADNNPPSFKLQVTKATGNGQLQASTPNDEPKSVTLFVRDAQTHTQRPHDLFLVIGCLKSTKLRSLLFY